jgi:hypothetical protein
MYDPSDFTHPYARPGTFLYSERGAVPVPNSDAISRADAALSESRTHFNPTDGFPVTRPVVDTDTIFGALRTLADTFDDGTPAFTNTLAGDRYAGVPAVEYARTPGRHASEYTQHARTFDRIWVTLFGTSAGHPRHARRDG